MITHVLVEADRRLPKDEQRLIGLAVHFGAASQDVEGSVLRVVRKSLEDPRVGRVIVERDWDDER